MVAVSVLESSESWFICVCNACMDKQREERFDLHSPMIYEGEQILSLCLSCWTR